MGRLVVENARSFGKIRKLLVLAIELRREGGGEWVGVLVSDPEPRIRVRRRLSKKRGYLLTKMVKARI